MSLLGFLLLCCYKSLVLTHHSLNLKNVIFFFLFWLFFFVVVVGFTALVDWKHPINKRFPTDLGASSTTFWFLLWIEHSLSFSHRALPCLSAKTYKKKNNFKKKIDVSWNKNEYAYAINMKRDHGKKERGRSKVLRFFAKRSLVELLRKCVLHTLHAAEKVWDFWLCL